MNNQYSAINASAGSGKTYQLVQRLLLICLQKPNQHTAIRHTLALTFTNKAANEMKERILSWLGKFSSEDFEKNSELMNIQKKLSEQNIDVSLEELHRRSKKLLDYVLHNYSILNIGTIDKFNARLVRSFSQELGLAKNFNLEIQPEPFLIEAVDQMLDQVGENTEVSESFLDFVTYSLDNEKRINLNQTLYDAAKIFINDVHYEPLKKNAEFDTAAYQNATQKIRNEIAELKKSAKQTATQSIALIQSKGLENSDFYGGGNRTIQYFFENYLSADAPKLFKTISEEENKVETYRKGASKIGKPKEHLIFEILEELIINRKNIIKNFVTIQKKEKILAALLPLKVNRDIQGELKKIEEENDLVLLSKFNVLINENLKNEPSEFLYEKIGSKFHHYFFDEFQDTSELQWRNFVPLRNHSISTEGTSFTLVGDPKQSIYRFRGGESQLMLNIINKNEPAQKHATVEVLKENWRSSKNIVQFNNLLYEYIAQFLKKEHQKLFGEDAQQIAKQEMLGRVKIHLLENDLKNVFYQDVAERMQRDIQHCVHHGFKFSDITILCRGNKDILHYAQLLSNITVEYNGQQTTIRTFSEKGLTLELSDTLQAVMCFLNWEIQPKNKQHLAMMLYYLNKSGKIQMQDYTQETYDIIHLKNRKEIVDLLKEKYDLKLEQIDFPKLNLYNYTEYFVHEFAVAGKETDFLLNFLETLFAFTQNSGATIKDFIKFWNEEASVSTIQASENIDAIQIMTIHKSKGLEFPVVFLAMENTVSDGKFNDWFMVDESPDLASVNINQFSKELEIYDEDILRFNLENTYRNFIDRLCVQYVATTRAVEQLYLYLQKPKNENNLEILDFVQKNNHKQLDEFDYFEDFDLQKQLPESQQNNFKTQAVKQLSPTTERQQQIKIATPSRNYQAKNEKVRNGIFLHEILSLINSEQDIDKVLEQYILNGHLNEDAKNELKKTIQEVVAKYPDYFTTKHIIQNEKEIMTFENGVSKIYRPDRIVATPNGYIIIDFKTGDQKKDHEKQILQYQKILESLGKNVLKTELIYL